VNKIQWRRILRLFKYVDTSKRKKESIQYQETPGIYQERPSIYQETSSIYQETPSIYQERPSINIKKHLAFIKKDLVHRATSISDETYLTRHTTQTRHIHSLSIKTIIF
jgi:hypothetical protein